MSVLSVVTHASTQHHRPPFSTHFPTIFHPLFPVPRWLRVSCEEWESRTCVKLCGFDFYCTAAHFFFPFAVCFPCLGFLCFIGFPRSGSGLAHPQTKNQNHLECINKLEDRSGVTSTRVCAAVIWSCLVAPTSCCLAFQLMALATLVVSPTPSQTNPLRHCPPRGHLFRRCTPNEAIASSSFSWDPQLHKLPQQKWRSSHFWAAVNRRWDISLH